MTSASLDGMTLKPDTDGTTLIRGPVTDQAALHELLAELCAFDLPLVSVARVEVDGRRTLPTCSPTATSRTPVPVMTTTARRITAWHDAQPDTSDASPTPVPHDMSCACCGHGLHVYLGCGDGCECGPQIMPGTAA